MKITNFTLENFKSFKNSNNVLSDANNINFIFGHNNSGKSNILKFINLVMRSKNEVERIETATGIEERITEHNFCDGIITDEPFIFHKNKRKTDIKFDFTFSVTKVELQLNYPDYALLEAAYFNNGNANVNVRFVGRIYSLDEMGTSLIELERAFIDDQQVFTFELDAGTGIKTKTYFAGKAALTDNRQAFENLTAYFNNSVNFIDNNRYFLSEKFKMGDHQLEPSTFKNWLYNNAVNNFTNPDFEEFLEFVRKYKVGSKLTDLNKIELSFSLDENNNLDIMLNKGDDRLPISSFGTGISQILFILAKIFSSNSPIVVIEEVELNLSPNTQKELFSVLRLLIEDNHIDQVFFTSHSPFFMFRDDFSKYEVTIGANKISSIERKTNTTLDKFFRNQILK